MITIYRHEVRPFTRQQIALMETFADQAVIAIENARLFAELQSSAPPSSRARSRSCRRWARSSQAVSSTLDLETVLTTIVSHANQLAGTDGGTVYEYDEADRGVSFPRDRQPRPGADRGVSAALRSGAGEGDIGRMAVTREPVQIPDIGAGGRVPWPTP